MILSWLTTFVAIISTLLFVASTALYIRSLWIHDELTWYWPDDHSIGFENAARRLGFSRDRCPECGFTLPRSDFHSWYMG